MAVRRSGRSAGRTRLRIDDLDDPVARAAFDSLGVPSDSFAPAQPLLTAFELGGEEYRFMFGDANCDGRFGQTGIGLLPHLGEVPFGRQLDELDIALVVVPAPAKVGLSQRWD